MAALPGGENKMYGEKLKTLRKRIPMTQFEFSKRLGIGCSTVAMWETGKRDPSLRNLQAIAELADMSLSELLSFLDHPLSDKTSASSTNQVVELKIGQIIITISVPTGIEPSITVKGEN